MRVDFDILTFDCYGTLIDWRSGIVEAFAAIGSAEGLVIDADRVLELHARIEPEMQTGSHRSYREVLDRTAVHIATALELPVASARRAFLSQSLPSWPPFADTGPALEKLAAAGYDLGVLSNTDDDLLAATLERLAVDFELVVTAERVGSYKPARGHFDAARRQIGERRWLHVAQSWFHDVAPALALELPVVWINRLHEEPPSPGAPLAVFSDLATFADAMAGGRSRARS